MSMRGRGAYVGKAGDLKKAGRVLLGVPWVRARAHVAAGGADRNHGDPVRSRALLPKQPEQIAAAAHNVLFRDDKSIRTEFSDQRFPRNRPITAA